MASRSATATAVLSAGAIPVLCEVDETLALDPNDVEAKITPQTKALIPVHHVYSNWAPVLEHRIGHHPLMNPFNFEANQKLRTEYSADMCPKTLDILSRTVYLGQHCDWNDEEVDTKIKACRKAAREL